MTIELLDSFRRDVLSLDAEARAAVFEVVLNLPVVLGDVHRHQGVGIRKLHPSGIWEARAGLRIRIVFGVRDRTITLRRAGTHDEIRRYLRSL